MIIRKKKLLLLKSKVRHKLKKKNLAIKSLSGRVNDIEYARVADRNTINYLESIIDEANIEIKTQRLEVTRFAEIVEDIQEKIIVEKEICDKLRDKLERNVKQIAKIYEQLEICNNRIKFEFGGE